MGERVDVAVRDGAGVMGAYHAAVPGARAGVVLVQEIFGVNAGIRAMADRWAAEDFACLAPDLFWRLEPGVELDAEVPAQFDKALSLYARLDIDTAVEDIAAAVAALRARGCGRVGVVGYCLGGLLAYLAAARTDADASVGYYGVSIEARLGEAATITRPLLLHNALEDGFVPPAAQAAIRAGLAGHPRVRIEDYPADHGFARHAGAKRVAAQAELADARTLAFLREHLEPRA